MISASHPRHGAFLSELRSLGFTTTVRPTATGGRGHAAITRNHSQLLIVIPPSAIDPGMILDLDQDSRLWWPSGAVPAECLSGAVRVRVTGAKATGMNGQDCTRPHPDALKEKKNAVSKTPPPKSKEHSSELQLNV